MKKYFAFFALILAAATIASGCGSMSSCFTRNGSRVPSATIASSTGALAEFPVSAPVEQVIYTSPMNSQCNPCTPACSNPCDPCSTGTGASQSSYPGVY